MYQAERTSIIFLVFSFNFFIKIFRGDGGIKCYTLKDHFSQGINKLLSEDFTTSGREMTLAVYFQLSSDESVTVALGERSAQHSLLLVRFSWIVLVVLLGKYLVHNANRGSTTKPINAVHQKETVKALHGGCHQKRTILRFWDINSMTVTQETDGQRQFPLQIT